MWPSLKEKIVGVPPVYKERSMGRKFKLWKQRRSNEITLVGDGSDLNFAFNNLG